jgi:hypothetical protein
MPPTDPLREQILEAIKVKLQAIDGTSIYFNTVKSTSVVLDPAVNIFSLPPTEMPFFIIEPMVSGSKFYMPAMKLRHEFQVLITARADVVTTISLTNTSRKTKTWEELLADIEVALTRDITLGGLCVDVRLLEATPGFDLGSSPSVFVNQPLVVKLIRTYGSPWNS